MFDEKRIKELEEIKFRIKDFNKAIKNNEKVFFDFASKYIPYGSSEWEEFKQYLYSHYNCEQNKLHWENKLEKWRDGKKNTK